MDGSFGVLPRLCVLDVFISLTRRKSLKCHPCGTAVARKDVVKKQRPGRGKFIKTASHVYDHNNCCIYIQRSARKNTRVQPAHKCRPRESSQSLVYIQGHLRGRPGTLGCVCFGLAIAASVCVCVFVCWTRIARGQASCDRGGNVALFFFML